MKQFLKGFIYAWQGIVCCVREERNFRFHLCAALPVFWLAFRYYAFTVSQWGILFLTVFGVLALEAVNSAIERAVGLPDDAHDALAGQAKDMAAGAVLLFCVGAVCVGVALFWQPAVFAAIGNDWREHPAVPVLLCIYLLAAGIFIFRKRVRSTK